MTSDLTHPDLEKKDAELRASEWTCFSEQRPIDPKALYRWRVGERKICGLMLRPEWSEKLKVVGMGHGDPELWPLFSDWNGYRRTVEKDLEWRLASEDEPEGSIYWGGLDLLPSPFTGEAPIIEYYGQWIGAPPYKVKWFSLQSWMVNSSGWENAAKMRDAWNKRPPAFDRAIAAAEGGR